MKNKDFNQKPFNKLLNQETKHHICMCRVNLLKFEGTYIQVFRLELTSFLYFINNFLQIQNHQFLIV